MRYSVIIMMLVGLVAGGLANWPTFALAQDRHPVPAQVTLFEPGKTIKNSGSVISNAGFPVEVYSGHSSGGSNILFNVSTPIIQMSNIECQVQTGCVLQISNFSSYVCPYSKTFPAYAIFYTQNSVDGIQSDNSAGPAPPQSDINKNSVSNSSLLNSVSVAAGKHTVIMKYLAVPMDNGKCQIGNIEMDVTVLNK